VILKPPSPTVPTPLYPLRMMLDEDTLRDLEHMTEVPPPTDLGRDADVIDIRRGK
jgi:hypothetical protein